jgi:prolyl oligopeptidase
VFLVACGAEPPLPPAPPAPPPVASDAATSAAPAFVPPLPYPASRRVDQVDDLHGTKVADPYRWLEDGKSDEVTQWAAAQDALARSTLAKLPGRQVIADRMKQLLYLESTGMPQHAGNRWMYSRKDAGKEKAIVYWREGRTGTEKVLLDPLGWSSDGSVSLGEWTPSLDGKKVAYAVHANNGDEATLYVLDVGSGKKSDVDVIDGAMYAYPSWTPSGDGFYYTWVPPKGSVSDADRPGTQEARFHKLGTDPKKDHTVFEHTGDPTTTVGAYVSRDGRWLLSVVQHGWNRSDVRFMDLRAGKPAWQDLTVGKDASYVVTVDRGRFFVHTNEGAPNWRVFRVDPKHPARDAWVEIVPERPDAMLESADVVGHELSLLYLKDVVSQTELHDEDGKLLHAIELPGIGAVSGLSGNPDDDLFYYSFRSFTIPTKILETSARTGKTTPWYEQRVPVDPSRFVVEQKFATSKDGTRVPFFVVRPKTMKTDGSTPTVLTGYGGFDIASKPYFAASIYPWLEQGGAWVVANMRGGSEYGEAWHRHGMLHEKQNVFDDFFAVAQSLNDLGIATPRTLVVDGASNGGLLVGAAITQHPEMFRVALCGVPLLDMVRYPKFGQGQTWVPEYGNPDDAADFAALYAYSPYHHVVQGTKYPATLIMSADSDDRVDPMHARKFAAELQWASTGGPVLLRVEKHSGHGGADLVKASIEMVADEYAFALDQLK